MKKTKQILSVAGIVVMTSGLVACSNGDTQISVISREDGSGTRSAFVELMGILEDGNDAITETAEIASSTSVVMTSVQTNNSAIGYISLGVLDDSVKALKIDNVEPSVEDIKNGSYPISRDFNIVTKSEVSEVADDFIKYILSSNGQKVVNEEGYISIDSDYDYSASGFEGTISIAGSTSVAPLMEVLAEDYMKINDGTSIEIQQSGSSAGITSAIEGACDIGMASRDLTENELTKNVKETVIAIDGICVITNKENPVDSLTAEDVKNIFLGTLTDWSEIKE